MLTLSGCGLVRTHKTGADFDQALLDKQLLDAATSIQRTQAELHQIAIVNLPPRTVVPTRPDMPGAKDRRPITINWNGDASDLIRMLAIQNNLRMEVRGIKLPLPVAINANRLPYGEVMSDLVAQIDNRAAVYPLPGRLVLEYLPTTGVIK
jgi:hypothetical protein